MNILRLVALAKEGWVNRPRASSFAGRAEELRKMAIALEAGTSGYIAHAAPDQNSYVKLAQPAQESPRDAVMQGWSEVSRLLQRFCDLHRIQREGGSLGLLNSLEHRNLLDFHAYALLRDMNAYSDDAMATASRHIAPPVARDYAVAVRGAKRLLHLCMRRSEHQSQTVCRSRPRRIIASLLSKLQLKPSKTTSITAALPNGV